MISKSTGVVHAAFNSRRQPLAAPGEESREQRRRCSAMRALNSDIRCGQICSTERDDIIGGLGIPLALPLCVAGRHGGASLGEDQPAQERRLCCSRHRRPGDAVVGHHGMRLVPQLLVDDSRMLAGIDLVLVHGEAEIDLVVQEFQQVAPVEHRAALGADPARMQFLQHLRRGTGPGIEAEDRQDVLGLGGLDHQLAVLDHVAEWHRAAHPHPLPAGGRELVADPLADHLALELGEAEQDVQRQPAHGRGGVEGLRDRDERHAVAVEDFHQLREVHQRAAEAIDLVDHDHIDQSGLDIGDQLRQRGPVQRPAREAAIVIAVAQRHPALGAMLSPSTCMMRSCDGLAVSLWRIHDWRKW